LIHICVHIFSHKRLKHERERERETARRESVWRGVAVRGTAFKRGWLQTKFPALKVPRQRPSILPVEVRLREGKALGSGKGKGVGYGLCYEQKREVEALIFSE
jgi:hypothetical protein